MPPRKPQGRCERLGGSPLRGRGFSRDSNRKKLAALCGLAPFAKDSGQKRGVRFVHGGRNQLRRALYMATLSAIRQKSSPLQSFYLRLRSNGKPTKVALIACARKLLTYLNSQIKNLENCHT